jgi:hypothetical protein
MITDDGRRCIGLFYNRKLTKDNNNNNNKKKKNIDE